DRALRNVTAVELVALRRESTLHLSWFLPWALVRALLALAGGGVSRVLCGDAIVWATIAPVVTRASAKSTVMVHGLDLSFSNPFYQRWIRWSLPKADRIVANSTATADATREHGVDATRVVVMNPGIRFDEIDPNVRVHGDMEGFGLVAAEAASRGALVLASDLEGIKDAVVAGATGILVEPEQPDGFIEAIRTLARNRDELATLARRYQLEARSRF